MFKLTMVIAITILLAALIMISQVPADLQLPIHWNSAGVVDKYANAHTALLFPPAVTIALIAVIFLLRFFEPRKENLSQSKKAVYSITFAISLLLGTLELGYIAIICGAEINMQLLVVFMVGISLMIIGNFLSKTKSNYFIGIRTPWALQNDENWRKTHRLSGRLFMITGFIVGTACWIIRTEHLTFLIVGLVLPSAIAPSIYSWWLWKKNESNVSEE